MRLVRMSYVPFDGRGKGQKTFYLHDYRWKVNLVCFYGALQIWVALNLVREYVFSTRD